MWVLLVACPTSREGSFGQFLRHKMAVAGMSIGWRTSVSPSRIFETSGQFSSGLGMSGTMSDQSPRPLHEQGGHPPIFNALNFTVALVTVQRVCLVEGASGNHRSWLAGCGNGFKDVGITEELSEDYNLLVWREYRTVNHLGYIVGCVYSIIAFHRSPASPTRRDCRRWQNRVARRSTSGGEGGAN